MIYVYLLGLILGLLGTTICYKKLIGVLVKEKVEKRRLLLFVTLIITLTIEYLASCTLLIFMVLDENQIKASVCYGSLFTIIFLLYFMMKYLIESKTQTIHNGIYNFTIRFSCVITYVLSILILAFLRINSIFLVLYSICAGLILLHILLKRVNSRRHLSSQRRRARRR